MADPFDVPRKVRSIWPPLLLLALSVGYAVWAQKYGDVPRLMPTIVGVATAILAVLDLLSRFDTRVGNFLKVAMGADFANREMGHNPGLRDEVVQIGWMVGCILGILTIGILPTIPLFIASYMRLFGGRPWLSCALSALLVLAFVTLTFEVLLDYTLYRGVLFDPKGFGAW